MSVTVAPYWIEREVPAMGSTAHVIAGGVEGDDVEWALDELACLERSWSRFRPDSDVSQLNARAGEWVEVTRALLLALERSRDLWRATDGAFNPAVLRALEAAGYDTTFELVRSSDAPPVEVVEVADFGAIEIDVTASAVRLPHGMTVDLGGIGKGLAADLVADGLVERGADSVLVSLGGDIRVAGRAPWPGWVIPVEDPFTEGSTAFEHVLADGAIVTSTTRLRTWQRGPRRMHHVIDPSTGMPSESGVTAVVVAGATGWWAEGMAKAALILGPAQGGALLRRHGLHGWVFLDDHLMVEVTA